MKSHVLRWAVLVCLCILVPIVAGQDENDPHLSADGRFKVDDMPDFSFVENFDPTDDQHQMMIASYPFEIDVDRSIIDDTTTIIFSTHDSDEIEDGQVIISVVTNENWRPFDTVDAMLNHWYGDDTVEQFRQFTVDDRDVAELDISTITGKGLYTVVMLDDGMYALVILISPQPTLSTDMLQGVIDEFLPAIQYIPANIIPLEDLDRLDVDDDLLAGDIPAPDGRYTFRAPQDWAVRINQSGTVTLSSEAVGASDLPEFALEFTVQDLSPHVRQPEAYIVEQAEMLGAPLADASADSAVEWTINGRRIAIFDDYADFTGLTLVMLVDDETMLVMNGFSGNDDAEALRTFAVAVADSIE